MIHLGKGVANVYLICTFWDKLSLYNDGHILQICPILSRFKFVSQQKNPNYFTHPRGKFFLRLAPLCFLTFLDFSIIFENSFPQSESALPLRDRFAKKSRMNRERERERERLAKNKNKLLLDDESGAKPVLFRNTSRQCEQKKISKCL